MPGGRLKQSWGFQHQGSSGSSGDDACVGGNDGDARSMVAMMESMAMRVVRALAVGATGVARV